MKDTSKLIRKDIKIWSDKFTGKSLKVGWGGLGILLLILKTCLAILEHLEDENDVKM